MATLTYRPEIFEPRDIDTAKRVILTPEGSTTEDRWTTETPFVADLVCDLAEIGTDTVLLDYGCGIGRLAKELIARHGCRVIGVDISPNMRALAASYVGSDRFVACSPDMLAWMVGEGVRLDAAIAIWVLQHCLDPAKEIDGFRRALKPKATLFVLNNQYRAVPTKEVQWVNDGIDIKSMLRATFELKREGMLPPDVIAPDMATIHFWAAFRNQPPP